MRFAKQYGAQPPPDSNGAPFGPRPLIDREELSWVVKAVVAGSALGIASLVLGICAGFAVLGFKLVTGVGP